MRFNRLGNTGLLVSELCLGTMTFGQSESVWTPIAGLDQAESEKLVRVALDAGINFIDTANVYSEGRSEEITGQALRNIGIKRDEVVVATKALGETGPGPNNRGASRYNIMAAVEASLKRLQLDHIDLYQIHGIDPLTPVEETVRAFDDLVRRGLVRYVGVSNWPAWKIAQALGIARGQNLARFESLQAYYTVAGRDLERELVPLLEDETLGLMVWSPLAGGLLSGKYARDDAKSGDGRRATFDFPPVDRDRAFDLIDLMRPMAEKRGVSVAQVALAWLLHQPVVTTVIVGAKREDQLRDNLGATEIALAADELAALDKASALPAEYPGWMLERQGGARRQAIGHAPRGRPDAD